MEYEKTSIVVALGSDDARIAKKAAELIIKGVAPLLVCSGGIGRLTPKDFTTSEAEVFADIAEQAGVARSQILTETESANTGENFLFTKKLLADRRIPIESVVFVTRPYAERRILATAQLVWKDPKLYVASPNVTFADYINDPALEEETINLMVGEVRRIRDYPKRGFMVEQDIPDTVWSAHQKLAELGYDKELPKDN